MSRYPNHLAIDGFLCADLHDRMLGFALANAELFRPTKTIDHGRDDYRPEARKSRAVRGGLGDWVEPFEAAIRAVADQVREALRIPDFTVAELETEMVAHGDGDFFKPHQDTSHGLNRQGQHSDRLVTVVYYLNREPRGFSGGELALYPFSPSPPLLLEPRDNRLLAFPAIALHEVRPIAVPGGAFADSRFSVNCWFRRERESQAD